MGLSISPGLPTHILWTVALAGVPAAVRCLCATIACEVAKGRYQVLETSRTQAPSLSDPTAADDPPWKSWIAASGLVVTVAIAYVAAARLSLALVTMPDGVAAFWPAAGIAAGAMIALGPAARLPVAIGVVAATILANVTGDRHLPAAVVFAVCNAGESLLI